MTSRAWLPLYYTTKLLDLNGGQFGETKKFTKNFLDSHACLFTLVYRGSNLFRYVKLVSSQTHTSSSSSTNRTDKLVPAYMNSSEIFKIFGYRPFDLIDPETGQSCFKEVHKDKVFKESENPLLMILGSTCVENVVNQGTEGFSQQFSFLNSYDSSTDFTTQSDPTKLSSSHSLPNDQSTVGLVGDVGKTYLENSFGKSLYFFSIDVSHMNELPQFDDYVFKNLLSVPTYSINELDATLFMKARGIAHYHRNRNYCGKCGENMQSQNYGSFRACSSSSCKFWEYPRIDPAVIMLIYTGEYCLLGHKSVRNVNFYSCLAGFASMGESIEQTIERETYEETGIKIDMDTITFFSSQPWFFPQSLMFGFSAQAKKIESQNSNEFEQDSLQTCPLTSQGGLIKDTQGIIVHLPKIELLDGELEDAKWFHMSLVKQMVYKSDSIKVGYHLPMEASIAFQLIKNWVDQTPIMKASI